MSNYVRISLLGPDFLYLLPDNSEHKNLELMKKHWERQLDCVLPDKPDLIVLPEICDSPWNYSEARKEKFHTIRKGQMLELFRKKARENKCHIAYAWKRQLDDGTWRNSISLIGRDGNIIGEYDKNYVTIPEMEESNIRPGSGAKVLDCDFGRIGCVICFDLNFIRLCGKYAAARPDIIIFSSYFHGSFLANYWAYKCNSYVAGAVARNECYLISPAGRKIASTSDRFRFLTHKVNLDRCLVHVDRCEENLLHEMKRKYGEKVKIDDSGMDNFLITSETEDIRAEYIVKEFGLETFEAYRNRISDTPQIFDAGLAQLPASISQVYKRNSIEEVRKMAKHIKVSAVGIKLASFEGPENINSMANRIVGHLKYQLEQVLPSKPDLIVLPEVCDRPWNLPITEFIRYYSGCGPMFLDLLQETAQRNKCNIIYTSPILNAGDYFVTSARLIDRTGGLAGIYHKNSPDGYLTGKADFIHDREAKILECDFGRIACIISSDFFCERLMQEYALQKPDLIVFPSSFYGGFLQQYWAYSCRSYLAGAVCDAADYSLQCSIVSPVGRVIASSTNYYNYTTENITLDYIVAHIDFNRERFKLLKQKYGPGVRIDDPGHIGSVLISSMLSEVSAEKMAAECSVEKLDHYLARYLERRREFIHEANASEDVEI